MSSPAQLANPFPGMPVLAVISAGLAPVVLVSAWVIAGTLQPASYSPVRQTVSVLAGHAGTDRWIMTAGLLAVGCCHLVTAAGLTIVRARARIVLTAAGIASIGVALSPEPAHGTSLRHLAWTVAAAAALTLWPVLAARTEPRPLIVGIPVTAVVTALLVVLLGWLVVQTRGGDVLGLAERLTAAAQNFWPFPSPWSCTASRAGRPVRLPTCGRAAAR